MPAASRFVNEAPAKVRELLRGALLKFIRFWGGESVEKRRQCPRQIGLDKGSRQEQDLAFQRQFALWQVLEFQMVGAILCLRTRSHSFLVLAISKTAYRFQWEVTMDAITGPILYVLIAWGIVTTVFMLLLIRRSLLASHEDDQIFLDGAQEHMAREQRELIAKINTLSRPLLTSGIASGALLLVLAGLWLYNGLKNF